MRILQNKILLSGIQSKALGMVIHDLAQKTLKKNQDVAFDKINLAFSFGDIQETEIDRNLFEVRISLAFHNLDYIVRIHRDHGEYGWIYTPKKIKTRQRYGLPNTT